MKKLVLLLLIAFSFSTHAQYVNHGPFTAARQEYSYKQDLEVFKKLPGDVWTFITAPVGWDKREWLMALGVATMTTAFLNYDENIRDFFIKNQSEDYDALAELGEMLGDSVALGGTAAMYVAARIIKHDKLRRTALATISALLTSTLLTSVSKAVIGRARPYTDEGAYGFHGPIQSSSSRYSFPSGHTSVAFTVASSIAHSTESKIIALIAYSAATLAGMSRVYHDAHWTSDVFIGAVIGYLSGKFFARINQERGILIMPEYRGGPERSFGIRVEIPVGRKPHH